MTSTFNTLRSYLYSTATAPPTISNPTLPNGWADTLATRALPSSSSRRDKGKRRGAIPVWGGGGGGAEEELVPDEEDEEGVRGELGEEEKDDDAREKRDREERELTDISERVLYQVSLTLLAPGIVGVRSGEGWGAQSSAGDARRGGEARRGGLTTVRYSCRLVFI